MSKNAKLKPNAKGRTVSSKLTAGERPIKETNVTSSKKKLKIDMASSLLLSKHFRIVVGRNG